MKRILTTRRLAPARCAWAASTSIFLAGCTHVAEKRAHTQNQLAEHSRALTTAVVDALHLQPPERRDAYTELALRVARQDQRIEGLPVDPIEVETLALAGATNALPGLRAERKLSRRFGEIEKLIARERSTVERLLAFGGAYEAERNHARSRWARWISGSSLLVGGLIALLVFVPAAIPVLGRLLGWLVGKIPALAGAIGVVSVRAFDGVVKGIERAKSTVSSPTGLPNERNAARATPPLDDLHLNLSREMDAAHKALVRSRKAIFR